MVPELSITSRSGPLPAPARRRVLVAEDQPMVRQLLARSLRAAGYDVTELSDGTSLWRELMLVLDPHLAKDPYSEDLREADLVVSDVRMPGLDGLEVLARLRASGWSTPFILVTAFGSHHTHAEGTRLGAARIFAKPLDVQDVVEAARGLVDPEA